MFLPKQLQQAMDKLTPSCNQAFPICPLHVIKQCYFQGLVRLSAVPRLSQSFHNTNPNISNSQDSLFFQKKTNIREFSVYRNANVVFIEKSEFFLKSLNPIRTRGGSHRAPPVTYLCVTVQIHVRAC